MFTIIGWKRNYFSQWHTFAGNSGSGENTGFHASPAPDLWCVFSVVQILSGNSFRYLLWEINRIYFLLTLSTYEKRSNLEPEVIEKIAKALDIPEEAITELGEATSINIFSGTWQDNAYATNYTADYQHLNPLEKVVELYERLLKAEQEKVAMLQEVLKDKK